MVSKNFKRSEFACQCGCGFDAVDVELLQVLQDVRDHFGKKTHINSGCRCIRHNQYVGGDDDSQHLISKAADIVVFWVNPVFVADYLNRKYPDKFGIGRYTDFTHVDVRAEKARWGWRHSIR